jgi:molecular chaperone DnaJ
MAKRDYYQVLDVPRTATEAEIKKSYRRLAMKFHPDRNPDDNEAEGRFKEVKEAYEVLTDAPKRAAYDQFGHAGVDAASRGGAGGGFDPRDAFGDIFGDVFGDIFGGGRRGRSQVFRGADLRYELELELERAVFGANAGRLVRDARGMRGLYRYRRRAGHQAGDLRDLPRRRPGAHAAGLLHRAADVSALPGTRAGGRGAVRHLSWPGPRAQAEDARGQDSAGVDTGDRIRLTGEGEAGRNGGPPGDLYVEVRVREHEIFERDGSHLSCEVPITFATATLGGNVEVPTLEGNASIKVPPETQSGRVFRLREKGIVPVRGGPTGDLFCRVVVETPVHLTRDQKELLRKFEASMQEDAERHHPREESWFDGVKRFFTSLSE